MLASVPLQSRVQSPVGSLLLVMGTLVWGGVGMRFISFLPICCYTSLSNLTAPADRWHSKGFVVEQRRANAPCHSQLSHITNAWNNLRSLQFLRSGPRYFYITLKTAWTLWTLPICNGRPGEFKIFRYAPGVAGRRECVDRSCQRSTPVILMSINIISFQATFVQTSGSMPAVLSAARAHY